MERVVNMEKNYYENEGTYFPYSEFFDHCRLFLHGYYQGICIVRVSMSSAVYLDVPCSSNVRDERDAIYFGCFKA